MQAGCSSLGAGVRWGSPFWWPVSGLSSLSCCCSEDRLPQGFMLTGVTCGCLPGRCWLQLCHLGCGVFLTSVSAGGAWE